jgi:transcriptional regulator with PAS, ATPase and Fis domain
MKKKEKLLFCWLGHHDLRASTDPETGPGPIGTAVLTHEFDEVILLHNRSEMEKTGYEHWFTSRFSTVTLVAKKTILKSTSDYDAIYRAASNAVEERNREYGADAVERTYHLSPGSPAMAVVWILLAKAAHGATLIECAPGKGCRKVSIPFQIYMEHIVASFGRTVEELSSYKKTDFQGFASIIRCSAVMEKRINLAATLAVLPISVLILGEPGTGKELFARAIHDSSLRSAQNFVAINCGSIHGDSAESVLFGHIKGAFTGADHNRPGAFEQAKGGTLFLDEVGELTRELQVKLLRVIQEKEYTPMGTDKARKADVRLITATNRDLQEDVTSGRFRLDLFSRIAVGILILPALRDRPGDIQLLTDHFLKKINSRFAEQNFQKKSITAQARKLLQNHSWLTNVRELDYTLQRAFVMASLRPNGTKIEPEDIRNSLLVFPEKPGQRDDVLNRSMGNGFSLKKLLKEIEGQYVRRAVKMEPTLKKAGALLGYTEKTMGNKKKEFCS